jgi:phosphoglycolate phosphatase
MDLLRNKLVGYSHIIWDWNGTLLADVEHIWESTAAVLQRFKMPEISFAHYREEFSLPLDEYYQKLGFDSSQVSWQEVAHAFQEEYLQRFKKAELYPGSRELLAELGAQGKINSVLSASSQTFLQQALEHFALGDLFAHVYGVPNHYALGKAERGIELLRETGIPAETSLLIGDTDHDLEVGREMGVEVLLIADGHQTYERLSRIHHNVLESRYQGVKVTRLPTQLSSSS